MELERESLFGGRITGALHTHRHDDAIASAAIHARRILSNPQQQSTALIRNTKETALDLSEDRRCISRKSEDDQISNSASSYDTAVHGCYQSNEIKECDNMNPPKDYKIHTNNMPENMSAQESSNNMTDMETMVLSKKCLYTAPVEIQEAKLQGKDDKKALTYEDSDSLESKDCLIESHKERYFSNVENLGLGLLRRATNRDSTESLNKVGLGVLRNATNRDSTESVNKVISAEEHDTTGCTPFTNSYILRGRSPMNWFPRRRTESYLEWKIRRLREVEGMNATLDEILGGSYPHLSRIEREKLAAQAAVGAAMRARKAALVEAAWCRILKAARIPCELAEVQLLNAEKKAAEAFNAAASLGVVMHDKPGGPKQSLEIETLTANGSQTHTVSASFETAFEVDKEVAGAVKVAFAHLAFLPASAITDIFNVNDDACRRVSIKPDEKDIAVFNNSVGFEDLSSESEAQIRGEQQTDCDLKNNTHTIRTHKNQPKCPKSKKEPANEAGISKELIDLMLERMELLKEDELVSLAMIVATRGLSAMLREENKEQGPNGECNSGSLGDILVKHVSRLEEEKIAASKVPREPKKKSTPGILPDLGSILVKHVSKLEREVQEARKSAKAMQSEDQRHSGGLQEHVESLLGDSRELGSLFVQYASNFEREVPGATEFIKAPQREERRSTSELEREKLAVEGANAAKLSQAKAALSKTSREMDMDLFVDVNNDYDKENREVNSASIKTNAYATDKANSENTNNLETIRNSNFASTLPVSDPGTNHAMKNVSEVVQVEKKQQDHNNENSEEGLDKLLVKHVSRLEKAKMAALTSETESSQRVQRNQYQCESLDKILVKHVSKLEKLKMAAAQEGLDKMLKIQQQNNVKIEEGLDKILIKHVSKLEREKQEASPEAFQRVQRKQHRHHDENNMGSLDKVLVKRLSRLEKEKQEASPKMFQRVQSKQHIHDENNWESLDGVLIKHLSTLEKEKLMASGKVASQEYEKLSSIFSFSQDAGGNDSILERYKNARDQEIQDAWGGMSLGNSLRPHLSKLELDKAAWRQAEEEELKRVPHY